MYVEVLQVFSAMIIICDHKHISFDEKLNSLLKIFRMNTLVDNFVDNVKNHYDKHLIHRDTILNMIESSLMGLLHLYTNTVNKANDDSYSKSSSRLGFVPKINTKHICNTIVDSIYIKTDYVYGSQETTQSFKAWYVYYNYFPSNYLYHHYYHYCYQA